MRLGAWLFLMAGKLELREGSDHYLALIIRLYLTSCLAIACFHQESKLTGRPRHASNAFDQT